MDERRQFEILKPIGRGGMGTVYQARLTAAGGFSKMVALKIASPNTTRSDDLKRLRDEARLLGLVRHRAIVAVDGLVRLGGSWAVIMEYVEGSDLAALIEGVGALPVAAGLEVVAEVAAALDAAFTTRGEDNRKLRLQHRDIKPGNVLVTPRGEVKILDFGIARANFASRETVTMDVAYGSAGYMSPERLDSIDHPRADVYSLGVVLYEMLMGDRLGKASSHQGRHEAFVDTAAQTLAAGPLAPLPDVVDFIRSMLTYSPDDRPETREVERQARALIPGSGSVLLRDWAEREVPDVLHRQLAELASDDMNGAVLSGGTMPEVVGETSIPPTRSESLIPVHVSTLFTDAVKATDPEPPPVPRRRTAIGLATAGAALIVLAMMLGAGRLGMQYVTTDTGVAPDRGSPPAEPEPAPPSKPVPEKMPGVERPADVPAPVAAAPPEATPAPTPEAQPPPAAPAPRRTAVSVVGDPATVRLERGGTVRTVPGKVPRGAWTIQASFGEGEFKNVGKVEIGASPVILQCSAAFARCQAKR